MKTEYVIEASGLHKEYVLGNVKVAALKGVSLRIKRGDMVCISGRSGSGKSTLLRQLSLIDVPDKGVVIVDGEETAHLDEKRRSQLRLAKLGYVFQEYALISELTAQENVALPALMLGQEVTKTDCMKRAKHFLATIGMADRLKHRPNELSGGQQQRVAIARALVNNPSIIFADEPTANLDSISARTVMETLKTLNEDHGVTVVFVSHDPDDVVYAKRVVTLKDGKVIEETSK